MLLNCFLRDLYPVSLKNLFIYSSCKNGLKNNATVNKDNVTIVAGIKTKNQKLALRNVFIMHSLQMDIYRTNYLASNL